MKRIEDAPKELQDMFATIFDEWWNELCPNYGTTWMYEHRREVLEHYFLKGFDVAMATGGLPEKRKRKIAHLTEMGSHIYVLSTDGKLFRNHWASPQEWQTLPDLPQED